MSPDIYRAALYADLRPFLLARRDAPAAEISGDTLRREFGHPNVSEFYYPTYDLMDPPAWKLQEGGFGLVYADQVLEHVPSPSLAVAVLHDLLRPGGWAVLTTVFLFPIHDARERGDRLDFHRFTPRALEELFVSWEEVRATGWGNDLAAVSALRWRENRLDADLGLRIAERGNHPDYPVVTWVIARKRTP